MALPFAIPKSDVERVERGEWGLLEVLEQVGHIRHQWRRYSHPDATHPTNVNYCPLKGAVEVNNDLQALESGNFVFDRAEKSKMEIGSWIHAGLELWFVRLFNFVVRATEAELDVLHLPTRLREVVKRVRAEGGVWVMEKKFYDPVLGFTGHADLVRLPVHGARPAVIDIKTGAGLKKPDIGHHRQLNMYAACLFPAEYERGEVEMGILQVRFHSGYKHEYWFEQVDKLHVDLIRRIRLFRVALEALRAGDPVPGECAEPPTKLPGFPTNKWQCKAQYCRAVDCTHRKVPKPK